MFLFHLCANESHWKTKYYRLATRRYIKTRRQTPTKDDDKTSEAQRYYLLKVLHEPKGQIKGYHRNQYDGPYAGCHI